MVETHTRLEEYHRPNARQVLQPSITMPRPTVINPSCLGVTSKIGEMEKTVSLNRPLHSSHENEATWPSGPSRSKKTKEAFTIATNRTWLRPFRPVLYTARHSGASLDAAQNKLSIGKQKRGRWRQMSSVNKYEKRGAVHEVWSKNPTHCATGSDALREITCVSNTSPSLTSPTSRSVHGESSCGGGFQKTLLQGVHLRSCDGAHWRVVGSAHEATRGEAHLLGQLFWSRGAHLHTVLARLC